MINKERESRTYLPFLKELPLGVTEQLMGVSSQFIGESQLINAAEMRELENHRFATFRKERI